MPGGNRREHYRERPAQEHQNSNGAERDKARELEGWRRGRAMAWDDYVQVALAHALPTSGADDAIGYSTAVADRLLAERDRRFGA